MSLMHLSLIPKSNQKGVFILAFASILIFLLLYFLLIQTKIYGYESDVTKKFLTSSTLITKKAVHQNNLRFLIKDTIEEQISNKTNISKIIILANSITVLNDYLKDENFLYNDLSDNVKLTLDLAGADNSYYNYNLTINTSVKKEISYNGMKLDLDLPEGYTVGGSVD